MAKYKYGTCRPKNPGGKNINKVNKIDGDAYFLGFIILLPSFLSFLFLFKSDLNKWIVYLCIPLPLENGPAK